MHTLKPWSTLLSAGQGVGVLQNERLTTSPSGSPLILWSSCPSSALQYISSALCTFLIIGNYYMLLIDIVWQGCPGEEEV